MLMTIALLHSQAGIFTAECETTEQPMYSVR